MSRARNWLYAVIVTVITGAMFVLLGWSLILGLVDAPIGDPVPERAVIVGQHVRDSRHRPARVISVVETEAGLRSTLVLPSQFHQGDTVRITVQRYRFSRPHIRFAPAAR